MATETDIDLAKRNTDGADGWTDEQIGQYLDAGHTVREFAYIFWTQKAAGAATLIDVSESGSSRSLGSLHSNFLAMADRFGAEATEVTAVKKTKKAVRR